MKTLAILALLAALASGVYAAHEAVASVKSSIATHAARNA